MSMAGPSSSLARVAGRAARSSYARLTQLRGLATEAPASPAPASSSSSQWSPPISPGTCAAYDEALAFISSNQADIKRRITELQQTSPQAADSADAAERKRLLDSLTVASEINDPKVRWSFTNTAEDQLDLTDPTTRHLREWAWRKCGSLDKLVSPFRVKETSFASLLPLLISSVPLCIRSREYVIKASFQTQFPTSSPLLMSNCSWATLLGPA